MIKSCIKICLLYLKGICDAYIEQKDIYFEKGKKYAFVMLAADYNNLGDIAITKAQIEFLKKNLSEEYQVIEVIYENTYKVYKSMKSHLKKDSIITLIGGGNSGTLYDFIEAPRRFILKKFSKNIIISFPQSVVYGKNLNDMPYRNKFINLCKKCKHLTLIARESNSYEEYKKMGLNNVEILLAPDIVFSLERESNRFKERNDQVSFIFRKDKEKQMTEEKQKTIINALKSEFKKFSFDDTCDVDVSYKKFYMLETYINKIKSVGLVVTNRLHGMILCYITNTPCIAIANNNGKIESTYKTWLKNQNFIFLFKDGMNVNELRKKAKELSSLEIIEKENMQDCFAKIKNSLT